VNTNERAILFQLLTEFQAGTHQTNADKGFYSPPMTLLEEIALVHSEVSEASEEYRASTPFLYYSTEPDKEGKPEGIAVEFADAIIRMLNAAKQHNIPVIQALFEKADYNKTRPVRHGGKKC